MNKDYNTDRMLIEKYMDKLLNEEEKQKAEFLLANNEEAREMHKEMQTAVTAVKYAAINQQVSAAAQSFFNSRAQEKTSSSTGAAKVISFRRVATYSLRAAAVVLLVIGSYTAISYQTVNADGLYADGFVPYDIAVTRNSSDAAAVETAYMQQNWQLVINAANQQTTSPKTNFLAGVAAMQLHQYPDARNFFENLVLLNKQSADPVYVDDAEYYLALTYIKLGELAKAQPMLETIRKNPYQQYYQAVKNISSFKLDLLKYKQQ